MKPPVIGQSPIQDIEAYLAKFQNPSEFPPSERPPGDLLQKLQRHIHQVKNTRVYMDVFDFNQAEERRRLESLLHRGDLRIMQSHMQYLDDGRIKYMIGASVSKEVYAELTHVEEEANNALPVLALLFAGMLAGIVIGLLISLSL